MTQPLPIQPEPKKQPYDVPQLTHEPRFRLVHGASVPFRGELPQQEREA
jgi:hypothetical protein